MVGHGKKELLVCILKCILNICVILVSDFSLITQIFVPLKELNTFSSHLQNFDLHLVYSISLLSYFKAAALLEH